MRESIAFYDTLTCASVDRPKSLIKGRHHIVLKQNKTEKYEWSKEIKQLLFSNSILLNKIK